MQASGNDIQLAIREDDLSTFAMDLLTISEDISDLFSSVDSKMDNLKNYFDGSKYDLLMDSYRSFRKNYTVVKNDIVSYSDDLIAVINKVRSGDNDIAFLINQITEDTIKKSKEVEIK